MGVYLNGRAEQKNHIVKGRLFLPCQAYTLEATTVTKVAVRIENSTTQREEAMRKDVEFKTQDGVTLAAWHYLPDQSSGKVPTIVMAHGFQL